MGEVGSESFVRTAERTEHTVHTSDGAELAVSVTGPAAGPSAGAGTVVLAHGWGAGRPVWRAVTARLTEAGHTVVRYDQRGHGSSTPGTAAVTIPRLAADLCAVLSAVDARNAVVVGHSGGGFAALSYAIDHRADAEARLRGLVLVSTAAHDRKFPAAEIRLMRSRLFTLALSRPWLGRKLLGRTVGRGIDRAALESHRRMFATTPGRVRAAYFASSHDMDLRAGLATVTLPAVVLAGGEDQVLPPALGVAVTEALPNARYQLLPDIGHMVPLEAPDAVCEAVAELS